MVPTEADFDAMSERLKSMSVNEFEKAYSLKPSDANRRSNPTSVGRLL